MFIVFRGEAVHLARGNDGFYRDKFGTVFALRDDSDTMDIVDRCGIGPLSLPEGNPLNPLCARHDYTHVSPSYQAFYTRLEADEYLRDLISKEKSAWRFLALPFFFVCRAVGGWFWENKETR
jgi:hypothetical protein